MRSCVSAAVSGLLLGLGMLVSGMVDPARVLGFFDVFGIWDPSLALVMGGALTVAVPGFLLVKRRQAPLCGEAFSLPAHSRVDRRLLAGAATFGVGWGLVGFCPGPGIAAAAAGTWEALAFCLAMAAGMTAWRLVEQGRAVRRAARA